MYIQSTHLLLIAPDHKAFTWIEFRAAKPSLQCLAQFAIKKEWVEFTAGGKADWSRNDNRQCSFILHECKGGMCYYPRAAVAAERPTF